MKMQHIALILLALLCGPATAQVACASLGTPKQRLDSAPAPKILTWVTTAEDKFNLKASNWRGLLARAPTKAQSSALELQALTADWEHKVSTGSVDAIFRAAVTHGMNVQYETLVASEDAAHADTHRHWADLEAARASVCLALIRQP